MLGHTGYQICRGFTFSGIIIPNHYFKEIVWRNVKKVSQDPCSVLYWFIIHVGLKEVGSIWKRLQTPFYCSLSKYGDFPFFLLLLYINVGAIAILRSTHACSSPLEGSSNELNFI